MSIKKDYFSKTSDGRDVFIYTLSNSKGMSVKILNYGGIIYSIMAPDRDGNFRDIALGYDDFRDYEDNKPYFGAIIGRNSNRIGKSSFEINGKTYGLFANDGRNHLHGGAKGFNKVLWDAEVVSRGSAEALKLTYLSRDGEENYPGNVDVEVLYELTEDNEIKIEYFAVSDQDTLVNLTNHTYFNLQGHDSGEITKHEVMINADRFTVSDDEFITTGEIRSVEGTPMDFRKPATLEPGLSSGYQQIIYGKGYDHNWILNVSGKCPEKAAEVYEPVSGRVLEVFTTKPAIQFYSGNFLDGTDIGKGGVAYNKRNGLCLETQFYPNAINRRDFPSPILRVGEKYNFITIYKFQVR